MVSMLIRFGSDTDPEPLIEFMCCESEWKKDVQEIRVLDDDSIGAETSGTREAGRYLPIRVRGRVRLAKLTDICSLEKMKRSIQVHMRDGTSYTFYGKLEDIAESLGNAFCRCHKSYVVNLEQAEGLRRYEILMKNGAHIPVSQKKYHAVREIFYSFTEGGRVLEKNGVNIEK